MQFLFMHSTKIRKFYLITLSLFIVSQSIGQELFLREILEWKPAKPLFSQQPSGKTYISFEGSCPDFERNYLPLFIKKIQVQGSVSRIAIENAVYEDFEEPRLYGKEQVENDIVLRYFNNFESGVPYAVVQLLPVKKNGNSLQRLRSFSLRIFYYPNVLNTKALGKGSFATNSVLATGDWYRVATTQNGIFRMDYNFLKNLGINPDDIDPRNLKLFGNGAGMLPEIAGDFRYDDLHENAIYVQGESDGKFNPGDYVLFYGQSQSENWRYHASTKTFSNQPNLYADTTYYYLTISAGTGKRVVTAPAMTSPDTISSTCDALYHYEKDLVNFIKSGKNWFGEEFNDRQRTRSFTVSMPDLKADEPLMFSLQTTSRSPVAQSMDVKVNGLSLVTQNLPALGDLGFEAPYTNGTLFVQKSFTAPSSNLSFNFEYLASFGQVALAWLDWFRLQGRNILNNSSGQLLFRDSRSVKAGRKTQFTINSSRSMQVWDVSKPTEPFLVSGLLDAANSRYNFITTTDSLKTFACFDGTNFLLPKAVGRLPNQNLHGLPPTHLLIITHPEFKSEAERLAKHHNDADTLKVSVVTLGDVYQEFSSGSQDIAAVRDFIRMLYFKYSAPADKLRFVLLFGRASYDYKNRIKENTNFIPTYESADSWSPIGSFCSDDFFACLDDTEGNLGNGDLMEVAVGRIPAASAEHAKGVVDKIINYSSNKSFNDWRNRVTYVADDDYEGINFNEDIEIFGDNFLNTYRKFNVNKVLTNAYQPVYTAGGKRAPDAQQAIVRNVQQGCLMLNYVGHGGEVGWSARRILNTDDINNWTNFNALPVFVTATCEFSRFDDPARISAGEMVLLNPKGGGIGLLTTVRLVFSSANFALNSKFHENLQLDTSLTLSRPFLGEVMRRSKNAYPFSNTRNFTLLGDPALKLAYPELGVRTTHINGKPAGLLSDTLKALSRVTVSGIVTDATGNVKSDFNGLVFPTVYDKMDTLVTVDFDNALNPPFKFRLQNSVIYRGKATVANGHFTFSFIVPKDINYRYDLGKISYYAHNNITDASGYDNTLVVGGTSPSPIADNKGPDIKLWMLDRKFINGGSTNSHPLFIADIFDSSGINVIGKGVGTSLKAIMDNKNTVILNDYFHATLDNYQAGEVNYDYANLEPGPHSIVFHAYDVQNNHSQASIDFVVESDAKLAIKHLLNYPNPFTGKTTFHFDHNQAGQDMSVLVQIFTVTGKLVKTLSAQSVASNSHFDKLDWDGKDDYGDPIGKGVYLYKVTVKTSAAKSAEEFQKLVILN